MKKQKRKTMSKTIDIEQAFKDETYLFIDVRSPGEYQIDTIPGALNLPILNDEERKEIGILYKQQGSKAAEARGFELKEPTFETYVKEIRQLMLTGKKIVLFCWRGGNRSGFVQAYLAKEGIEVLKLSGGYKSYRRYLNETLPRVCADTHFIVLHGRTGVGKTELLNQLKEQGIQTLDLEGYAANAGSVFGNVFYREEQPQQKQFESRLFNCLIRKQSSYVIVESESKRIGKVFIPDAVFDSMVAGDHYLVTTPMEVRVEQIKKDYIKSENSMDAIIEALSLLKKSLGNERLDAMQRCLKEGRIDGVIEELMRDYYDPMYDRSIQKYEPYKGEIAYRHMQEAVDQVLEIVRKYDANERI